MLNILLMSPPFGIDWGVWISVGVAIVLASIGVMGRTIWNFATWKAGLDEWKNGIEEWKKDVKSSLKNLQDDIVVIKEGIAAIRAASERDANNIGMTQRRSPLVPTKEAIEILEDLSIISEVDANISYIKEENEKRAQTSIYREIEDPEERFIEIAPGVIHALIKKGKIEEKKIDEAMDRLEQVFPGVSYYGVLLLIAAYILEKRREKGFIAKPSMIYSQIDMIASKDRDEALASYGGDAEKAIKSLEMSIRTLEKMGDKNELTRAHYNLGFLLGDMGRKEDAEAEYREALRINPDSAEAHYNLGFLLGDMGKKEDAEAEYREALRINPDYADAHNNLGILLDDMGRKEDAEAEYRETLRINPDYAEAHYNLGILLDDMGRKEDAEAEYREALRINPDSAEAHNNFGILLDDMGRKEDAEAEYQEALRINPDSAEAHGNLGILYSETGKKDKAKVELELAKELFDVQGRVADVKTAEELLKSL
jgi:tetratricopeptide (TPR) repeat protein